MRNSVHLVPFAFPQRGDDLVLGTDPVSHSFQPPEPTLRHLNCIASYVVLWLRCTDDMPVTMPPHRGDLPSQAYPIAASAGENLVSDAVFDFSTRVRVLRSLDSRQDRQCQRVGAHFASKVELPRRRVRRVCADLSSRADARSFHWRVRFYGSVVRVEPHTGATDEYGVALNTSKHRYLSPEESAGFSSMDEAQAAR